ncbi:SOS response-associated peptidase [Halomonas sp. LBP4]|uniref:SOS response-associated peptidase n=1 Tax=Halomonas sp. LBP4 TaxID=2044917 RepID=UPI0021ACBB50|nr:SOS response-associated peptidase [Halomonas sp. LBP4]
MPADGWYEWFAVDDRKQPHFITRTDGEPLWFTGIWAERADGTPGCAILTDPARGVAKEIHDRMPQARESCALARPTPDEQGDDPPGGAAPECRDNQSGPDRLRLSRCLRY